MCLVLVKTRARFFPALSSQVTHAIKQNPFIAVALTLENISNCSCFRLGRLNLFGVLGCCCIGRVFMKASALRWTCGYEGQSMALDLWLLRPEQLMPTRQPTTSPIV